MAYSCVNVILATLLTFSFLKANGQISSPCTSSMISSFTPCLNYVTRSSGTGSSPTEDCCNSLKSLITGSMDCTCLIITGNVPVSIPFVNRNLAISLPRICKSSVPLQCKASGDPLPAPGPVLFGPTAAPAASAPHSHSPKASKAATGTVPPPAETLDLSPASPPEYYSLAPSANPGIRPVFNPKSASNLSAASLPLLVLMFVEIMVFKF